MSPLDATVEQNGGFWVKKDTKGDKLDGCLKWTESNFEPINCGAKLSVVCQKEL